MSLLDRNIQNVIMNRLIILVVGILFSLLISQAQETVITGKVISDSDKLPIPYAGVYFKGTTVGTITSDDGSFEIYTNNPQDSIVVSFVGYTPKTIKVKRGKKNRFRNIRLKEHVNVLGEVVIRPRENPAHLLLRKINKHKKYNNPEKFSQYSCATYTTLAASLANLDSSITERRFFKKNSSIFTNNRDSSGYKIPLLFFEKLAENYLSKKPHREETYIKAQNTNSIGLADNAEIEGYASSMSTETNFYNSYIKMFDKSFASPISSTGLLYYKYYIEDSLKLENGDTEYTVEFIPRRKKELVFDGYFKVLKSNYALTEIEAAMPQFANINYLNKFKVFCSFQTINDSVTFFEKNRIEANFNYYKSKDSTAKPYSVDIVKNTSYFNLRIDEEYANYERRIQDLKNQSQNISSIQNEKSKKLLLNAQRTNMVSLEDLQAAQSIDSLNNRWFMKATDKISTMLITSYLPLGLIEIGPYLELYKRNKIEDHRFTMAARTGEKFNGNFYLGGKAGYGTLDKKWKYGGHLAYKFKSENRNIIGFNYDYDLRTIGDKRSLHYIKENQLVTAEDNSLVALLRTRLNDKLSLVEEYKIYLSNEWTDGFYTHFELKSQKIHSGAFVPFTQSGNSVNYFANHSAKVNFRFSKEEKVSDIYFRRYYMNTPYPVFNFNITGGMYGINKQYKPYVNLRLTVKHKFHIGLGQFKYIAEAGYIYGKVPFPLLEIFRANESFGYSRYKFNLMPAMRFASDAYAGIMAEYHLNGFVFNKLPLIRRLNLREVISFKSVWGTLDKGHRQIIDFPENFGGLNRPYLEVGAGVENILNFLRVEGVWRVSPKKIAGVPAFGIRAMVQVVF